MGAGGKLATIRLTLGVIRPIGVSRLMLGVGGVRGPICMGCPFSHRMQDEGRCWQSAFFGYKKKSTLSAILMLCLLWSCLAPPHAGTPFHMSTPFLSHYIGTRPQKHPNFRTHCFMQSTGTYPSNRIHSFLALL